MSLIKAFNNHLLEFIEDVITIFPDNADIRTSKTFLEGIKKVNPKKIIVYWNSYIVSLYDAQITEGDLNFFINKDYDQDVGGDKSENLRVLEDIRKLVKETTKENQKKAMKYVQNLNKICKLYFNN
tara:strand:+ start:823 stop:1200 length:378 start_codon:yes stop_codon:yes gene_type:complete